MQKYVKLIDGQPIEPPVNKDNYINYNLNVEQLLIDGYKPFIEAEIPPETEIRMYHFEYSETSESITEEVIFDETIQEAQERIAKQEKEADIWTLNQKISELETKAVQEMLNKNELNVKIYQDIINGLIETREGLLL